MSGVIPLVLSLGAMVLGYSYALGWDSPVYRWVSGRPSLHKNINLKLTRGNFIKTQWSNPNHNHNHNSGHHPSIPWVTEGSSHKKSLLIFCGSKELQASDAWSLFTGENGLIEHQEVMLVAVIVTSSNFTSPFERNIGETLTLTLILTLILTP